MISEDFGYIPTSAQQKLKSQFWLNWRGNPMVDPSSMSAAQVAAMAGDSKVEAWMRDPLFKSWFLNADEWRSKLDAMFEAWIDKAAARLMSSTMSDGDLIKLGKLLGEFTNRTTTVKEKAPTPVNPEQAKEILGAAALLLKEAK